MIIRYIARPFLLFCAWFVVLWERIRIGWIYGMIASRYDLPLSEEEMKANKYYKRIEQLVIDGGTSNKYILGDVSFQIEYHKED